MTTTDARTARDHKGRPTTRFKFGATTCAACPLAAECTKAKGGRQIMVSVHEARIAAARAAQADLVCPP